MPNRYLPAAGLPWFMTMFGRDSIITSLQTLPFVPELAAATLLALGEWQGTVIDDFRDEDPGRIPHEMRYGELTAFEERPHCPYYGCADATPLYVVLLDEYERWTGDTKLVRDLEYEARAALNWIDEYADLQGNGFVSYQRRNEKTGLENQCWKDSWDSISYRDGTLPGFPRATCELQGYAYDAKVRGARLARHIWRDPAFADKLEKEAADLKRRFNREFWVQDGQYFAVALDGDGRQVDSLTSNIGHLLWSGIVDKSKARIIARHLLGPRLFSGWGVRTMAEGEGRYNPIGYHVGAVWPFDNSFICWGLRRYGFKEEAARVAEGILDAAVFFDGRLPEAFGGYPRDMTRYPVQYPTACSPQAWSTGAPLLLLSSPAWPRAGRGPPGRRSRPPSKHRQSRTARHPRTVGSHRRLRPGTGRHHSHIVSPLGTHLIRTTGSLLNARFDVIGVDVLLASFHRRGSSRSRDRPSSLGHQRRDVGLRVDKRLATALLEPDQTQRRDLGARIDPGHMAGEAAGHRHSTHPHRPRRVGVGRRAHARAVSTVTVSAPIASR